MMNEKVEPEVVEENELAEYTDEQLLSDLEGINIEKDVYQEEAAKTIKELQARGHVFPEDPVEAEVEDEPEKELSPLERFCLMSDTEKAAVSDEALADLVTEVNAKIMKDAKSKRNKWLRKVWARCLGCGFVFTNAAREWKAVACPSCGRSERPVAELINEG